MGEGMRWFLQTAPREQGALQQPGASSSDANCAADLYGALFARVNRQTPPSELKLRLVPTPALPFVPTEASGSGTRLCPRGQSSAPPNPSGESIPDETPAGVSGSSLSSAAFLCQCLESSGACS